jgi:hypothetical protein
MFSAILWLYLIDFTQISWSFFLTAMRSSLLYAATGEYPAGYQEVGRLCV